LVEGDNNAVRNSAKLKIRPRARSRYVHKEGKETSRSGFVFGDKVAGGRRSKTGVPMARQITKVERVRERDDAFAFGPWRAEKATWKADEAISVPRGRI